jgi:hypothetical protein
VGRNLMNGTNSSLQSSSTLMTRLALAPSTPQKGGWRLPGTGPSGLVVGTKVLPAPPPPPPLSAALAGAIRANIGSELTTPSVPTYNWRKAVGQSGSANNAGNVGGADSNVTTTAQGFTLPVLGAVNPLWLGAGAIVLLLILTAGE